MPKEKKATLLKPSDLPTMNYKFRKITDLAPYSKNSRTHSLEQIHELDIAIGAYGFTNPILVDSAGIVAGHGRLEAVKARYARGDLVRLPNGEVIPTDTIPTLDCSGWSDAQRRAYIIFDNKSALNAAWDEDVLASELLALSQADFDMELTGFNADELSDLISDGDTGGLTDENSTPDVPTNPVTVSGDVWLLSDHRVMCGDSTSVDEIELLIDGQKADMVFTDPPYGMNYGGGRGKKKMGAIKGDDQQGESLVELVRDALIAVRTNAKSGAATYVCFPWRTYVEFECAMKSAGLDINACIVWDKGSIGLGHQEYRPQHEFIFYSKGDVWYGDRSQSDVWKSSRGDTGAYVHPTQKPVDLIEIAILNSSKNGDIVVDCFGGSGSTLIACEITDRKARIMELDQKYVDVIVKRWQSYTGLEATLESTGQTFKQVATDRGHILQAA